MTLKFYQAKFLVFIFLSMATTYFGYASDEAFVATKCFGDIKRAKLKPKLLNPLNPTEEPHGDDIKYPYNYIYEENTCFFVGKFSEDAGMNKPIIKNGVPVHFLNSGNDSLDKEKYGLSKKVKLKNYDPFADMDDLIFVYRSEDFKAGNYKVDIKVGYEVKTYNPKECNIFTVISEKTILKDITINKEIVSNGKDAIIVDLKKLLEKFIDSSEFEITIYKDNLFFKKYRYINNKTYWCTGGEEAIPYPERKNNVIMKK